MASREKRPIASNKKAFHDYFVFLWKTYVEAESEFSGEEKDIRDLLLSMPSALPNVE